MSVDPVCQMEVEDERAPGGKAQYWGQVFFFCSSGCRATFQRSPQNFAAKSSDAAAEPGYDPRMFLGDM